MKNYGFIVQPNEQRPRMSFDEGMDGTIFVDVEAWRVVNGKMVAHLYYKSNFAKFNLVTEEELRARFPKSFAKLDPQEEYTKLREKLDALREKKKAASTSEHDDIDDW